MASDRPDRRPLNERYPITLPKRQLSDRATETEDYELPLRLVLNNARATLTVRCIGEVDGRACEYERGMTFGPQLAAETTIAHVLMDSVQHAVHMHPRGGDVKSA